MPRGYQEYRSARKSGVGFAASGAPVENADVNRFFARFRLADSFQSVNLDGYAENTTFGYSQLTGLFYTWSAFELLLHIIGVERKSCPIILGDQANAKLLGKLRAVRNHEDFFKFVGEKTESKVTKKSVDSYLLGEDVNVVLLASAIRNIFAHGHLTPHSGGNLPEATGKVCSLIKHFLIESMNVEFAKQAKSIAAKTLRSASPP